MSGYANPHLLTNPGELAALIDGPADRRPLVIDLRPPEQYTASHIPTAIHLDLWGLSLTDTDPAPLKAFMWMIEHVLAVHGVKAETPVVVYDEQSGVRAARAFWFLEYFGHKSVRVLDGGFGAWTRAGMPVSRAAAAPPATSAANFWLGRRRRSARRRRAGRRLRRGWELRIKTTCPDRVERGLILCRPGRGKAASTAQAQPAA